MLYVSCCVLCLELGNLTLAHPIGLSYNVANGVQVGKNVRRKDHPWDLKNEQTRMQKHQCCNTTYMLRVERIALIADNKVGNYCDLYLLLIIVIDLPKQIRHSVAYKPYRKTVVVQL